MASLYVEWNDVVTTISSGNTDQQVPSAKAVYDVVNNINTVLSEVSTPSAVTPTTADYLGQTQSDKNDLADNLVTMGVAASQSETLTTLVPKVLQIAGGGGVEITDITLNANGTYTVTDADSNTHTLTVTETDGQITAITYDGDNVPLSFSDGVLTKVGNTNIDINRFVVDLLLHCDDFTDSGKHGLTITNSGADIDTSVKKFGTGSWHFVETTDNVKVSNPSTYFDFTNNDFTIDLWFYPTAYTGAIYSAWSVNTARSFILTTAGTAGLLFAFGYSSSSAEMIQTSNNVLTLNTWQHIAVTRSGNNFYIFVNGVLVKTHTSSRSINVVGSNNFLIGKNGDTATPNDHTTGYIDEIRILNGTCAWTSDFTPPTQPY